MKVNVFKRTLAALVTSAMVAGSVGAVSAGASSPSAFIPGSQLKCEMFADTVSDTEIQLNVRISNVKSYEMLSFLVNYDSNKCQFLDSEIDANLQMMAALGDPGTNRVNVSLTNNKPITEDIVVSIKFLVKDSSAGSYKFSAGVTLYSSDSEDLDLSLDENETLASPGESIVASPEGHLIGDVDMNGKVQLQDTYDIIHLVPILNERKAKKDEILTERDMFFSIEKYNYLRLIDKNLIDSKTKAPLYNCGVALDVDENGIVDYADAEAIMMYTSQVAINNPPPSSYIGSTKYVVCY